MAARRSSKEDLRGSMFIEADSDRKADVQGRLRAFERRPGICDGCGWGPPGGRSVVASNSEGPRTGTGAGEGVKERTGKEPRAREMQREHRERSTESNKNPNESLSSACASRASPLRFVDTRRIGPLFRLDALSLPIASAPTPPFPCVCQDRGKDDNQDMARGRGLGGDMRSCCPPLFLVVLSSAHYALVTHCNTPIDRFPARFHQRPEWLPFHHIRKS